MSIINGMTKLQLKAVDKYVDALQPELGAIVDSIEAKPKTTKNNYGRYMSTLNQMGGGDPDRLASIATAMIRVGANEQGVIDGLKALL